MDYKFGAIPSPPDYRDYLYRAIFKAEKIPRKHSRRPAMGPVRDQGKYGACVGFAAAAVKDNQERIQTSPLYVYRKCKEQDGIPTTEGTYPRVAMSVLKSLGICPETLFPYEKMAWPTMPTISKAADDAAAGYKIGAYAKVLTLDEVKQSVYKDGPVLGGVLVCSSFVNTKDGFIPIPGAGGAADYILGSHAICVVGYNDDLSHNGHVGYLEVKNSWGPDWGDGGYCYIPYDFFNYRRNGDIGMTYWFESWTSVDIITPPVACKEGYLWIDKNVALLDGVEVMLDVAPTIDRASDRTLVPLRFMAENFGYHVEWSESTRRIRFWR